MEFDDFECRNANTFDEQEEIIQHVYPLLMNRICNISTRKHNVIKKLLACESELSSCIDVCNSYLNEVKRNSRRRKVRHTMRIHISSTYKDGSKELVYPMDLLEKWGLKDVSKYMIPSTLTVTIYGYILNKKEDESISEKSIITNSKSNLEEGDCNQKEEKEKENEPTDSKVVETTEEEEEKDIDYVRTCEMKLTSIFSSILITLNKETMIYGKHNNDFYDVDRIIFSRVVKKRENTPMKVILFPEQHVPSFKLSPSFSKFMKTSQATIPEIVKKICEYSMENNLMRSSGFIADETLRMLLGVKEFDLPNLPFLLRRHFSIIDPVVLDHVIEIEEKDHSESIYEIELDTFEPCVIEDSVKEKIQFGENSDKISRMLKLIKHYDKKLEKENDKEEKKKKEDKTPLEEFSIMNVHNKMVEINKTKNGITVPKNLDIFERRRWLKSQGTLTLENLETTKNELSKVNDEIIDLLGMIKKKMNLRLKFEQFIEDPIKFINDLAEIDRDEHVRNINNDLSVLFDNTKDLIKGGNVLSDNEYYKNPWVNIGIRNYLKSKDENIADIKRSNTGFNASNQNRNNAGSSFTTGMNVNVCNTPFIHDINLMNPMMHINPMMNGNPNPMYTNPMINTINPAVNMNNISMMDNFNPMSQINAMLYMNNMNIKNNEPRNSVENMHSEMPFGMTSDYTNRNTFLNNAAPFFNNGNNRNMNHMNLTGSITNSEPITQLCSNNAMNHQINPLNVEPHSMNNENYIYSLYYPNNIHVVRNRDQLPMVDVSNETLQPSKPRAIQQKKKKYEPMSNSFNVVTQPFRYSGNSEMANNTDN